MSARFEAPAWAWLLVAFAVALFSALGTWQVRRGLAKQQMRAQLADRTGAPEILDGRGAAPTGLELRRAQASGTYQADRQLLEDGQSHREQPGYHAWTPLRLGDGALVLVDRGWIARDATASVAAPPSGEVTVTGFWRALPEPGLRLGTSGACPAEKKFPAIVLYPTLADVQCWLGPTVVSGLLLLDPDQPGGFVREWTDFGFPPERHFGYAFQWFVLAAAAVVIFLRVNRKP